MNHYFAASPHPIPHRTSYCPWRLSRFALALASIVFASVLPLTPQDARAQSGSQKPPRWVMQSSVQLAIAGDPRFKDVRATVTTPGTVVLEGSVFDRKARQDAEQAVSGVAGVTRVIDALTTTTFAWKLAQNRINQSLLGAGLTGVAATVVGNQIFLDGVVHSNAAKQQAVAIAQSTGPDLTIGSDIIRVLPSGLF
jgi:BON domain